MGRDDTSSRQMAIYVERMLTAQSEIIRCKDCVHYDDKRCELHDYLHFKENDFCSYAERKKE
jgi:hypothetical protein